MKYRTQIKRVDGSSPPWWEDYDNPRVTNLEQAQLRIRHDIEYFNSSLLPHEHARELVSVELVGRGYAHLWEKQNLVTLKGRDGVLYDAMTCRLCGAKARRPGLSEGVHLTPKFKKLILCPGDRSEKNVKQAMTTESAS